MVTGIGAGVHIWTGLEEANGMRSGGISGPKPGGIEEPGKTGASSFSEVLTNAVNSVEESQATADDKLYRVATGENADLHGTMIALEEANISLRTMASVRDKVVEAYQAIWNMPI